MKYVQINLVLRNSVTRYFSKSRFIIFTIEYLFLVFYPRQCEHFLFYVGGNHRVKRRFLTFLKSGNTFDYIKNFRNTEINDSKETNENIPRRNKYILENILLNIFKFYILKYIS